MAASTIPPQTDDDVLAFTARLPPRRAASSAKRRRNSTIRPVSDDRSSSPLHVSEVADRASTTIASPSKSSGITGRSVHPAPAVSSTPSSIPTVNGLPPSTPKEWMPNLFTLVEEEAKAMAKSSSTSDPQSEALSSLPSSAVQDGAAIPPAPTDIPAPVSASSVPSKDTVIPPAHNATPAAPWRPSWLGSPLTGSIPQPPSPKPDPLPPFRELFAKSAGEDIRHEGLISARLEKALLELPLEEQADAALDAVESQAARLVAWHTWRIEVAVGRDRSGEASSVRLPLLEAAPEQITTLVKVRDHAVDALLKLRERRLKIAHLESVNRRGESALRQVHDAVAPVEGKAADKVKSPGEGKTGKTGAVSG